MDQRTYSFPQTGSFIEDHGRGKIAIRYGDMNKPKKLLLEHIAWEKETVEHIHDKYPNRAVKLLLYADRKPKKSRMAIAYQYWKLTREHRFIERFGLVLEPTFFLRNIIPFFFFLFHIKRYRHFYTERAAMNWLGW